MGRNLTFFHAMFVCAMSVCRSSLGIIYINILTTEYGDSHGGVHEEEHVEEQEAEVGEHLGAVVTDVVVQSADQEPD